MKVRTLIMIAVVVSPIASAQTRDNKLTYDQFFGPALAKQAPYLTGPVADSYRQVAAAKFLDGAEHAGFSSREAKGFSDGMVKGDIIFVPGGVWGNIVSKQAGVEISLEPGKKKAYLLSFTDVQTAILEKYSTIRLLVKPAPPRDYKVIVNGEECPATEAGIYKVMPGESAVKVSRPSIKECEWHGPIGPGAVQEVDCSL
jgi:hypothetical protein